MTESPLNWDVYVTVASQSDVGMRRSNNQDHLSISLASNIEQWQRRGHLFIVADGMGAHAAGELASKIAVDQIPHLYAKYDELPSPEALRKSVADANVEIHRRGQANEDFYNMGTTCSVLSLLPEGAVCGHVGDSRVYRLRKNRLEQLTFDHSLVWEMRASGQLSAEEEASGKIPKNVITRSLGPYAEAKVDLEGPFPIEVGDTFLLCSDGLTGMVEDNELGSIMGNLPPDEAAKVLTDLANLRGGPDNITCIVIRVNHPQLTTTAGGKKVRSGGLKLPVHPAALLTFAALLLATILFCVFGSWQAAFVPAVLCGISSLWIIIQLVRSLAQGVSTSAGDRFGKGPYVRVDCGSGKQAYMKLKVITEKLLDSIKKQNRQIDMKTVDAHLARAEEAVKAGKFSDSVKSYSRCISFMMDSLRGGA